MTIGMSDQEHIADRAGLPGAFPLWPTKRLTTEAIDVGLGISYLPFEPDDFSQSLCPQLAGRLRSPTTAPEISIAQKLRLAERRLWRKLIDR